jgi:hypothetical protein
MADTANQTENQTATAASEKLFSLKNLDAVVSLYMIMGAVSCAGLDILGSFTAGNNQNGAAAAMFAKDCLAPDKGDLGVRAKKLFACPLAHGGLLAQTVLAPALGTPNASRSLTNTP